MPSQWPASKSILKSFHLVSSRKYTSIRISILDYTLPANILELCKINQTYTTTQLINTLITTSQRHSVSEEEKQIDEFLQRGDLYQTKIWRVLVHEQVRTWSQKSPFWIYCNFNFFFKDFQDSGNQPFLKFSESLPPLALKLTS